MTEGVLNPALTPTRPNDRRALMKPELHPPIAGHPDRGPKAVPARAVRGGRYERVVRMDRLGVRRGGIDRSSMKIMNLVHRRFWGWERIEDLRSGIDLPRRTDLNEVRMQQRIELVPA